MNDDARVNVKTVLNFLDIKYPRLDNWLKLDILGIKNSSPGTGNWRKFSFQDVAATRIAVEVMRVTNNYKVAREAVKVFRQGCAGMSDPSLMIHFTGEKFNFSWIANKYTVADYPNISVIIIPVANILKEVEKLFAGLEAKEKKAVLA